MVKLVKDIAVVVRDLQTLDLIREDSVATSVKQDEQAGYTIEVSFRTTSECADLCSLMIESVGRKQYKVVLTVLDESNGVADMKFEFRKNS